MEESLKGVPPTSADQVEKIRKIQTDLKTLSAKIQKAVEKTKNEELSFDQYKEDQI